jgi:hypothetical protein
VVCQCLSSNNINIDAAKTGVTNANMRIVNNKLIDIKGNSDLLFRNPDITKVLLVINKLVKDIVVLTPAKITEIIKISWLPTPVYFVFDENGVINVHPAVVKTRFEHFVT